jgi:hypothetical protein
MSLTPAQYTERRNTLAILLTDTTHALQSVSDEAQHIEPGLIQRHIAELTAIHAKVFENQFKLVLVARFQGGKSTTFNAVAMGGRVISPMGDGAIKCSASLISNYNCEDVSKRGVTLKWRSTNELARLCEDVLTSGKVDLTTPEGRSAARQAYEDEFTTYRANRQTYPPTQLELLPIVDLITRFVGDTGLAAMQEQLAASPPSEQQVAELVRFPKDFSTRWPDQADGFTLDESRFVFLQAANLATEAPNLKQLGLEVVDCPGLFASSYDTTVATAMIATADAVWYLLDGKTAGQSDLEAIALCRQLAQNALFVSVNLKADINPTRKHITTKIIPHIQGQLQQAGLTVELQPYHALLALLGQTGESLLRGVEDRETATFMHQLVDDWSLESASESAAGDWAALCEHLLDRLKSGVQDFRAVGGQLSSEAVAVVVRESGLSDILGKLGQFVVETRARTVLIDRGVGQAISAIENGIEKPLAALEAAANLDEDTARSRFDEAQAALTGFAKEVDEQLKLIDGEMGKELDRDLASEYFEKVIFQSVHEISRKSADEIVQKTGLFANALRDSTAWLQKKLDKDWGKINTEETIKAILNKNFRSVTELQSTLWATTLSRDTSLALKVMLDRAKFVNNNLQRYWDSATGKNEELKDLSAPVLQPTNLDVSSFAVFLSNANTPDIIKFIAIQGGIVSLLTGIAVLLPGIGTGFVVVATAVSVVFDVLRRFALGSDGVKGKIEKKLNAALTEQLHKEKSDIVKKLLSKSDQSESLSSIRESIVAVLQAPIKGTLERFNAQRHDAMALFQKKSAEREKIADDCRCLRVERVVPLRERLQAYKEQTEIFC